MLLDYRYPESWVEQLRPLSGRLFVRRDKEATTYRSLVLLPASYTDRVKLGTATVVAVAPDVDGFAAGDRVLLSTGIATRIRCEKTTLYVVYPSQIVGKLEGDAQVEDLGEAPGGRYQDPTTQELLEHAQEGLSDEGAKW